MLVIVDDSPFGSLFVCLVCFTLSLLPALQLPFGFTSLKVGGAGGDTDLFTFYSGWKKMFRVKEDSKLNDHGERLVNGPYLYNTFTKAASHSHIHTFTQGLKNNDSFS